MILLPLPMTEIAILNEDNTYNMHLVKDVNEGVGEASMLGFRFNIVGVSDVISMGTHNMCYILQSCDQIAKRIKTKTIMLSLYKVVHLFV